VIRDPQVPFDLRVESYWINSDAVRAPDGATGPDVFRSPVGLNFRIVEKPPGRGVSTDDHEDAPSVTVTLLKKGTKEELGRFVLSLWLYRNFTSHAPAFAFEPQSVNVDGTAYQIELRSFRKYRPYTLHLLEFRHDIYVGTTTAKNFSSLVRLADPETSDERTVLIRMNSPMRYRGETYYQSKVLGGKTGTILQVVDNPAWQLPYLSCAMVTIGLIWHFGFTLSGFLSRRFSA
jgi:hypothetical protein